MVFNLVGHEEAKQLGVPAGTGQFSELFTFMERQIKEKTLRKADVGTALDMTPKEKRVSFYNRYFIFKKQKHVETDQILQVMISSTGASPVGVRPAFGKKKKGAKKTRKLSRRINIETISSN